MSVTAMAPRYREIESSLRARIAALRPGQRLPSVEDSGAVIVASRD